MFFELKDREVMQHFEVMVRSPGRLIADQQIAALEARTEGAGWLGLGVPDRGGVEAVVDPQGAGAVG